MITADVVVPVRVKSLDEIVNLQINVADFRCTMVYRRNIFSIPLNESEQFYVSFIGNGEPKIGLVDVSVIKKKSSDSFVREPLLENGSIERWKGVRRRLHEKYGIDFKKNVRTLGDIATDVVKYLEFMSPHLYNIRWNVGNNPNIVLLDSVDYPDGIENVICRALGDFENEKLELEFPGPSVLKEGVLKEAYENPKLYRSFWRTSPPAEQKPHVLILELTSGCDYGKCTFCDFYGSDSFSESTAEQFMQHYFAVMEAVAQHKIPFKRVFLGSGNALGTEQTTLLDVLSFLTEDMETIERASLYGRASSIQEKGVKRLRELEEAGLGMIYLGAESGSDSVLKYVNKGYTADEMTSAANMVREAGIKLSVMFMPGVGGMKYFSEHAEKTAEFVNLVKPEYVTLIGIYPSPSTKYARQMEAAADNRSLTDEEISQQTRSLIEAIDPYEGKIGMHKPEIHIEARNPIIFNGRFDERGKSFALRACDRYTDASKFFSKFFLESGPKAN